MTIKQKFSSIDQSKLTADQKAFLTKIKDVTKNFTDAEMNKKVEAPLNGFIEKAKEKMPEAIKSAPVKSTSKAKPSQTRKPKRTAMSLAKEIRKQGESWNEARARASKMMKEDSKDLSKTVETELDKLSKLVKNAKTRGKLAGISGTDIKRDAVRKAKPRGARKVTHSGETSNQYGTFSNKLGRKYYESRDRHSDRLAPNYPKNAPLLENGAYLTDPNFGNFQNNVMFNKGGATTNERKHVNHDEDYEIRYAKPRPSRKGYKGVRGFELGGVMATDLAGHTGGKFGTGDPSMLDGTSGTHYTGLVGETGAMSSGEMFMNGGGLPSGAEQSYMITEALGNPAQHFAKGGGVRQVGNREYSYGRNWTNDHRHVNKDEEHEVKYNRKGKFLGMMNDKEFSLAEAIIFIKDAKKDKMTFYYNVYGGNDYFTLQPTFATPTGNMQGFPRKVTITKEGSISGRKLTYSKGGATTNERKHVNKVEDYEVRYAKPRPSRKGYKGVRNFAYGGGFEKKYDKMSKESKEELMREKIGIGRTPFSEYEKYNQLSPYHKELVDKHFSSKKMYAGGSMETPRIYVADLEAYNNGRLTGEWLDLADYDNADELMDAIQDVLKKSGGEEYAIHDVEYIPRNMYSEYMGQRDFEELYKMMDLAKENDLPLEVVQDIVSQYSENAVDDFVGKYDSAVDFAEQLVDDMGGIQNFNDFQYYLDISETDRRLLSQEMADSYAEDIRDEDSGTRLIEEAGLNLDEYENADEQEKEELLDLATSMVSDEYYDTWYEGLNDPYYFLVEEQGMYSAEDFANANFIRVDYEKLADALDQDYTIIEYDGEVYVFNIR
jgi:antirestriction protein